MKRKDILTNVYEVQTALDEIWTDKIVHECIYGSKHRATSNLFMTNDIDGKNYILLIKRSQFTKLILGPISIKESLPYYEEISIAEKAKEILSKYPAINEQTRKVTVLNIERAVCFENRKYKDASEVLKKEKKEISKLKKMISQVLKDDRSSH